MVLEDSLGRLSQSIERKRLSCDSESLGFVESSTNPDILRGQMESDQVLYRNRVTDRTTFSTLSVRFLVSSTYRVSRNSHLEVSHNFK